VKGAAKSAKFQVPSSSEEVDEDDVEGDEDEEEDSEEEEHSEEEDLLLQLMGSASATSDRTKLPKTARKNGKTSNTKASAKSGSPKVALPAQTSLPKAKAASPRPPSPAAPAPEYVAAARRSMQGQKVLKRTRTVVQQDGENNVQASCAQPVCAIFTRDAP
jgi:hypothetical protein